jgi:hypothetical protein
MTFSHHRLVALLHVTKLALETLALPEERLVGRPERLLLQLLLLDVL